MRFLCSVWFWAVISAECVWIGIFSYWLECMVGWWLGISQWPEISGLSLSFAALVGLLNTLVLAFTKLATRYVEKP